jgi:hypothetical protein
MAQAVQTVKTPGGVTLAQPPKVASNIWRFSLGDLNRFGSWLLPRLVESRKQPEQWVAGWLRGLIDSREHLFLAQANSVGLAEIWHTGGLLDPVAVRERFVLANGEVHFAEAVAFYEEFARWAKQLGSETLYILECSDVPSGMIKARIGTIFAKQQAYVKL